MWAPSVSSPDSRVGGIGATLVRELCATFDGQERVGWLETDKERNVRFYRAHGFEVVETTTIVGVPTWFMRRDPVRSGRGSA
jgi:hypothetical protein